MSPNLLAMLLDQAPPFGFGADTAFPQGRIAEHLADRHAGRLQTAEKLDPDENGCVIVPLARPVPIRVGQQPDPLVIADGMGGKSRALGEFTDLHASLFRHDARKATRLSAL